VLPYRWITGHNRGNPPLSNMEVKAATSRCPAQAVSYPAQGRGADSDGGGTAGTSLAGVVAASVSNSHKHESPHPVASSQRAAGSNCDLSPLAGIDQTSAPKGARGRLVDGAEGESDVPTMPLQNRTFKLATWNMCGQGTKSATNSKEKMRFVECLLSLERIDAMVLTETHTVSIPASCGVDVIEQTGLASRAGVVIIVKSDAGWEVLHRQVLIPSYTVLVNILHKQSREAIWILGVYRDISRGLLSLGCFLERLHSRLSAFVTRRAQTGWAGCFAIGDWNFMEHAKDRSPTGSSNGTPKKILATFNKIKCLCGVVDVSGRGPAPGAWSYSKNTHNGMVFSRLDRIYRPTQGWRSGEVIPIATNWSDHRVISALMHVQRPRVEKALPAPRLPHLEVLGKTKRFWPSVLKDWEILNSAEGCVNLESWTIFKEKVLQTGIREVSSMKKLARKDWLAALCAESIEPGRIMSAAAAACRILWSRPPPPARMVEWWPTAVPKYERADCLPKFFKQSQDSPWQSPVRVTCACTCHDDTWPQERPKRVQGVPRVADLLDEWTASYSKAARDKWDRMAMLHTLDWFKQSANKELDECGSRASVSVEGLRRPNEPVAHVRLKDMAMVAHDYFAHLHSPEPSPPNRQEAQ